MQVTIVRADQEPLTVGDLEKFYVFCTDVLKVFTWTNQSPDPARAYTPGAFQTFCTRYPQACQSLRAGENPANIHFLSDPLPLTTVPVEALDADNSIAARGTDWVDIGPRSSPWPGCIVTPVDCYFPEEWHVNTL